MGHRSGRHRSPAALGRSPNPIRAVVGRAWHKVFEDRILGLAAEAGFWGLLSLPSLLLALFGALGYLHGVLGPSEVNKIHDDVLRAARDVLTASTVNADVAPLVDQILQRGHPAVISVGFALSLWTGSTATSAYLNTITVAYDMRGLRSAVRSRIVALGLYLATVAVGVVMLPVLALGPDELINLAPASLSSSVSTLIHVVYWPLSAVGSVAFVATLYTLCLPVRVRWRRALPGAVVAMVLWLLGSAAVRAYLTSSLRTRSAYGSLGAPIAALLFFYMTALAVLIGAEINSAIDSVAPVATTAEGRERSRRKRWEELSSAWDRGGPPPGA